MPSTNTLATISNAIAVAEGFGVSGARPTNNNNPGDLKSSKFTNPNGYPVDSKGFVQYPTTDAGYNTLQKQVGLMLVPGSNSHFNPDMSILQVAQLYTTPAEAQVWANNVAKTIDGGKGVIDPNTKMRDVEAYIDNGTVPPHTSQINPAANGAPPQYNVDAVDKTPTGQVDLKGPDQASLNQAAKNLYPDLVIQEGCDNLPWYEDFGMVTGNPRIRRFVSPVSFRMLVKDKGGFTLATQGSSGTPIQVQLNASVKSYNKTMKHVYNKTNTRSGVHLTFWGMQADVIEASCTTGVFMNQLGLTDFVSSVLQNSELNNLLAEGFAHLVDANTGNVVLANAAIKKNTNLSPSAFRVAAQDAFVELLSIFKSNGNIWFRPSNYTGRLNDKDQAGISAWSPQTGLSSQQGNSRNNDVMTRGYIAMNLKDNTYLGYFKSLSWQMDAEHPFQWTFNFTFQVERTITLLEYPRLT